MPLVQEQHCAALGAPIKDVPLSLFFLKTPWHWGPEEEPLPPKVCFNSFYDESNFFVFSCGKKYSLRKK